MLGSYYCDRLDNGANRSTPARCFNLARPVESISPPENFGTVCGTAQRLSFAESLEITLHTKRRATPPLSLVYLKRRRNATGGFMNTLFRKYRLWNIRKNNCLTNAFLIWFRFQRASKNQHFPDCGSGRLWKIVLISLYIPKGYKTARKGLSSSRMSKMRFSEVPTIHDIQTGSLSSAALRIGAIHATEVLEVPFIED